MPKESLPRLLFIVNVDWFFLSHRLPIALAAQKEGYEVHIACGITDRLAELESYGFHVHPLSLPRGRAGILSECRSFLNILFLLKQWQPDIVHLVTIKPVLYGGISARILRIHGVVAAISGLGFMYVAHGAHASLQRVVLGRLYRLALGKRNLRVVFQNRSDLQVLSGIARLAPEQAVLLEGSGVDLARFTPQPLPSGTPMVLMACRLIANKGVWEFVEAARNLRQRGESVRFCLAGRIDPDNPLSLTEADLAMIRAEDLVDMLGDCSNMEHLFSSAHMVILPSYYGEGMPKVLIEAAACGRAVITTNQPGCRDAIEPNVTGLLIPTRDASALADAITQLLHQPEQCAAYGIAGRQLAEKKYDIHHIVAQHMQLYASLLK